MLLNLLKKIIWVTGIKCVILGFNSKTYNYKKTSSFFKVKPQSSNNIYSDNFNQTWFVALTPKEHIRFFFFWRSTKEIINILAQWSFPLIPHISDFIFLCPRIQTDALYSLFQLWKRSLCSIIPKHTVSLHTIKIIAAMFRVLWGNWAQDGNLHYLANLKSACRLMQKLRKTHKHFI